MKPRVSILSKEFRYTNSQCTDLRATFRRIKREQVRARAAVATARAETAKKVTMLPVAKRI